jgi:lipopolysaccharide biosynthesis glycosyltransferase
MRSPHCCYPFSERGILAWSGVDPIPESASVPIALPVPAVKQRVAAVAFCTDRFMEAPLHVAASSLLRNLHPEYSARFYLLLTGFSSKDIGRLRRTLDAAGRTYTIEILETSGAARFEGFPSLHGNYTTYHRLLLPDLVQQEEHLLYLDSDIQVKTDVSPLFEMNMESSVIGFVVDGVVSTALDSKFLLSLGRPPDGPTFNAGVMLLNLPEWRRQDCSSRVFAFCRKHSGQLINNDQSALNGLFAEECYRLDPRYNLKFFPTTDPRDMPSNGIFHFVGSPKPWDIGGRFLMPHAAQWFEDLRRTAIPFYRRAPWLTGAAWARLPRILGGYRRFAKQKLSP